MTSEIEELANRPASSLMDDACQLTGLSDWGQDDSFIDGLEKILESSRESSNFPEMGWHIFHGHLTKLLTNRLLIQEYTKRDPGFCDEKINKPLIIVSLPRTGTSHLQSLLSCDSNNRSLLYWEALTPVSLKEIDDQETDPRIIEAEKAISWINSAVPELTKKHEFSVTGPQECFPLLENSFVYPSLHTPFHLPRYREWLNSQDMVKPYRYYKQQLQLLQRGKEEKRWLLKAPMHMNYINELLTVFPDASIVQLHREPSKIVASACSLIESVRQLFFQSEVDLKLVGEDVYGDLYSMLKNCVESRKNINTSNVIDINYSDLVQSPQDTVRKIYQHFSYPISEAFENKMSEHISNNPQHKHGVHKYELEKYGLSEAQVQNDFGSLYEQLGVNFTN